MNLSPSTPRVCSNIAPTSNARPKISFIYQQQQQVATPTKKSGKENINVLDRPNLSINCDGTPKNLKNKPMSPKPPKHKGPPSFLLNKESQDSHIESTLCKCGKLPTYLTCKSSQKLCTKCGVEQMLKGIELTEYKSSKLDDNSTSFMSNSTIRQPPREMQLEQFLKDISEQKSNLLKYHKDIEGEQRNVRSYFKERKLELKTHYQKIKAAIKESIELDLKELSILEKAELDQWQNSRVKTEENMKKLVDIQQRIKPNIQRLLKETDEVSYQSLIGEKKAEISRISAGNLVSRIAGEAGQSNFKHFAYNPNLYRMHTNSELNEGSKLSVLSYNNYSDTNNNNNTNINKSHKKEGLLFSFEDRK